ncbi:MAG TPA: HK97 family phage prohead protease [Solirubrobacteraceae bacterium]|jgi:hypothetical protein
MDTHEERIAAFEAELREKYTQKDRDEMAKNKHAMPDGSFPIEDKEDVEKAIKAVGMGDASHDTIRKHIIVRAKALGCSDLIPDSWGADGSLKEGRDTAPEDVEERAECPTCKGTGKILEGNRKCPDCAGTGVAEERAQPTAEDYSISKGLAETKMMLAAVKAKQLADPDYKTDPDDQAVMSAIEKAESALDKAIVAQSKDGHEDTPEARMGHRRKPRHRAVPLLPEVRFYNGTVVEIRKQADTDKIVISGTPIVYDTPYVVRDAFGEFEERMRPGVASAILQRGVDVRFMFNHDGLPLARTGAGTMKLTDTSAALRMTATLDARQQIANDLMIAIERGDVAEMSSGFIVARDEWDEQMEHREVLQLADLLDVSAVTFPASPTTSVEIAKRMAYAMPEESRARMRKLYADVRAGKVLSQGNQDKLVSAVKALHEVLGGAGFDPNDLIEDAVDDDASDGGDATGAQDGPEGFADGTRSQADDDPGEPVRASRLAKMSLELAVRKRR